MTEASATSREQIFEMVRTHLSTELEIGPAEIEDEVRFREDLDADSLDLYELVMELEDAYGISMSEEQAAKIETVADAVDFVFTRLPGA
jgi:acyl carrier protein